MTNVTFLCEGGEMRLDADPRLVELRTKIEALLDEYGAAGGIQLASSTHGEYGLRIPEWSAVQFEDSEDGRHGIRVNSSSEDNGPDHLAASVHLILGMRDMAAQQAMFLSHVSEKLIEGLKEEGIELEHTTLHEMIADEVGEDHGQT